MVVLRTEPGTSEPRQASPCRTICPCCDLWSIGLRPSASLLPTNSDSGIGTPPVSDVTRLPRLDTRAGLDEPLSAPAGDTSAGAVAPRVSCVEEMAQETNPGQVPMLCSMGCGFYGNPRTHGLCSVCYKEHIQRQNSGGRASPPAPVSSLSDALPVPRAADSTTAAAQSDPTSPSTQPSPASDPSLPSESSASLPEDSTCVDKAAAQPGDLEAPVSESAQSPEEQSTSLDKPRQKKNRCVMCRKKVGLTGFQCRCGNVYCGVHRYSDAHNCSYNYKADAAEKIRKENPVVVGEKIQKI